MDNTRDPRPWLQVNGDKRSSELPPSIGSPQSRNEVLAKNLESSVHFLIETSLYLMLSFPGQSTHASWTLTVAKLSIALISTCLSWVLGRGQAVRREQGASRLSPFWVGQMGVGEGQALGKNLQDKVCTWQPPLILSWRPLQVPSAAILPFTPSFPRPRAALLCKEPEALRLYQNLNPFRAGVWALGRNWRLA